MKKSSQRPNLIQTMQMFFAKKRKEKGKKGGEGKEREKYLERFTRSKL